MLGGNWEGAWKPKGRGRRRSKHYRTALNVDRACDEIKSRITSWKKSWGNSGACPRCGAEFDATLFQFGHRVRCHCGAEIEYPGTTSVVGTSRPTGEGKAAAAEWERPAPDPDRQGS